MKKLHFARDEGSAFYKELRERIDEYFLSEGIAKTGNRVMIFKIVLYFGLSILFYVMMLNAGSLAAFYAGYLLMGAFQSCSPPSMFRTTQHMVLR